MSTEPDKNSEADKYFSEEDQKTLRTIRTSRIIIPIAIGLGVVAYMLWKQFDPVAFQQMDWSFHTFLWIFAAFILLCCRHLALSLRIWLLSKGGFTFRKCIELIFIWEFSSSVTPTTTGGSFVALFVFTQEKLPTARTAAIVIYTVVLDSIFFLFTLALFFLVLGPTMIRPDLHSIATLDSWGYTFVTLYFVKLAYTSVFFYGLFINPNRIRQLLDVVTRLPLLNRFHERALELGHEMVIASTELRKESWSFHVRAFGATALAWTCKFTLMMFLIVGMVKGLHLDFHKGTMLFARLEAMFVIMAFSPTPGGAGFAEIVFGGFLSDYVPRGISLIVAFVWRLMAYYGYLFAGTIVIPNWLNKIMEERRKARMEEKEK